MFENPSRRFDSKNTGTLTNETTMTITTQAGPTDERRSRPRLSLLRMMFMSRSKLTEYLAVDAALVDERALHMQIKQAEGRVARLTHELSPETRQTNTESLAKWQAHLDSLRDDGVPAIQKGDE